MYIQIRNVDCDIFWNALFMNNTIIENHTITQNYTSITTINNLTFVNVTVPENIDIIKERNRHDEELARISKGIVQSGNSSTIVLGDFVRKDEFGGLINPALIPYLTISGFGDKFEQFYALKQVNVTPILPQEIKPELKWYETPGVVIVVVLSLLIGLFVYNKWYRKKQQMQGSQQQINVIMPKEDIMKISKKIELIEEETKPEIELPGE
mgnify:FL=1